MSRLQRPPFAFALNELRKRGAHGIRLASAVVLLLAVTGCRTAPRPAGSADWDKYVEGYLNAYFAVHPDFAVVQGRHEFDGKLPNFSKVSIDREISRLHSERVRAAGFTDNLDQRQQFERDYLIAQIDSDLFWLESARWPYRNPFFYSNAVDPEVYLTRPYAPPRSTHARLHQLRKSASGSIRPNSHESPNPDAAHVRGLRPADVWRAGPVF